MSELDASAARLRWGCRRGMLELDVILVPYFDTCFAALTPEQKTIFERFLESDDPDLFAWLMGHDECKDKDLAWMVEQIVAYNKSLLR
ncbi:succinate dehydrogenase assembly factor 2 [Echinimonas agarilytica]|uniref:FAD assembly factor SdhE n=1 Tax=Echinimonas agarilytica TaxID=1215918 RepID=A0AA41W4W0_9GAMM|nr:succinate dehydrogenase assembly factor 2 [Echinimonas agarilytica]MCM2678813.1 succinate dehydrogenase assembly factor 2 [Echinimonas agarilytica]